MSNDTEKRYSVTAKDGYVRLKTWGELQLDDLDAPANAAIALAKEKGVDKLLDDIRDIESENVSIHIQTKAMGILWKLRHFKKVAIIFKGKEIGWMFFTSTEAIHINSTFKGFDNEADAIAWLQTD